jgi:hypothetical protein
MATKYRTISAILNGRFAKTFMTLLSQLSLALTGVYKHQVDEENHRVVFTMSDETHRHIVVISCNEVGQVITMMMKYTQKTPESQRDEMCVFMGEVNKRLMIGGFEMDLSDGECQYRHSVDVESLELNAAFFRALVRCHVVSGCDFWRGILAVQNGANYQRALICVH